MGSEAPDIINSLEGPSIVTSSDTDLLDGRPRTKLAKLTENLSAANKKATSDV